MARASGVSRRRLTHEQQSEIARLYGETEMSAAEIQERFGIAATSVYRVLQKQGVPLRGRATSPSNGAAAGTPARRQTSPSNGAADGTPTHGRATALSDGAAAGTPTYGPGPKPRGRPRRDAPATAHVRPVNGTAVSQNGDARAFRVRFEGQRIFEALDIRDALRQAETLGATSIDEVTRLA